MHLSQLKALDGQWLVFPGFSRSISFPSINLNIHIKLVNESLSICVQQGKNPNIKCFLKDHPHSGLFQKVIGGGGVMQLHPREEAEGQRLKNPFDTITEGLGINWLTQNIMMS